MKYLFTISAITLLAAGSIAEYTTKEPSDTSIISHLFSHMGFMAGNAIDVLNLIYAMWKQPAFTPNLQPPNQTTRPVGKTVKPRKQNSSPIVININFNILTNFLSNISLALFPLKISRKYGTDSIVIEKSQNCKVETGPKSRPKTTSKKPATSIPARTPNKKKQSTKIR